MAYDPNLPANHAPIVPAELRDQSNGLNDLITDLLTGADVDYSIRAQAARNVDAFTPLTLTISNPPTQAQVQAVVTKLNELITALQH